MDAHSAPILRFIVTTADGMMEWTITSSPPQQPRNLQGAAPLSPLEIQIPSPEPERLHVRIDEETTRNVPLEFVPLSSLPASENIPLLQIASNQHSNTANNELETRAVNNGLWNPQPIQSQEFVLPPISENVPALESVNGDQLHHTPNRPDRPRRSVQLFNNKSTTDIQETKPVNNNLWYPQGYPQASLQFSQDFLPFPSVSGDIPSLDTVNDLEIQTDTPPRPQRPQRPVQPYQQQPIDQPTPQTISQPSDPEQQSQMPIPHRFWQPFAQKYWNKEDENETISMSRVRDWLENQTNSPLALNLSPDSSQLPPDTPSPKYDQDISTHLKPAPMVSPMSSTSGPAMHTRLKRKQREAKRQAKIKVDKMKELLRVIENDVGDFRNDLDVGLPGSCAELNNNVKLLNTYCTDYENILNELEGPKRVPPTPEPRFDSSESS